MADDDTTAARSAAELAALRAAVARIQQGESTGFFDGLQWASTNAQTDTSTDPPADSSTGIATDTTAHTGSTTRERGPTRQCKEDALREAMARIEAAHPEGVVKPGVLTPGVSGEGFDEAAVAPEPAAQAGPEASPARATRDASERDADPYAVARAIVLRQLTMSPKSRQQLREKLRQSNCPDEVAEAVLDRMAHVGLVDDEKYAESYVRSKQVRPGLSTRAIAHELRTKGVDRDTAEAVLAEVSPLDEEERARGLVDARLPRLRELERSVVMRRLAGMLARKGYPSGLSLRIIREAVDADPAFQRD